MLERKINNSIELLSHMARDKALLQKQENANISVQQPSVWVGHNWGAVGKAARNWGLELG